MPQTQAKTFPKTLNLAFGSDLPDWEKHVFETLLERLGRSVPVRTIPAAEHRFLDPERDLLWVVSSSWEKAARALPYHFKGSIFLSPLRAELNSSQSSVEQLLSLIVFQKFSHAWSNRIRFLVHSPFARRFFEEIERVAVDRLSYVPLPVIDAVPPLAAPLESSIGFLGSFESDTNFPFLLSVLHYVHQRRPDATFLFSGRGRLENHLRRALGNLGLMECSRFVPLAEFRPQSLVYTPLRNAHYGSLLFAASRSLPTVVTEVMGLENYIDDGRHGLIASPEHVRAAAELLLRLLADSRLREQLGSKFREHLTARLSCDATITLLADLFFEGRSVDSNQVASAA